MEELVSKKRARDDQSQSQSELDSPEVKKLREDLLDNLDDSSDLCTVTPDLDSFMKSFEEEISASPSSPPNEPANEPTTESDESHSNLGYLLEASDDELGLPPSTTTLSGEEGGSEVTELARVSPDTSAEL